METVTTVAVVSSANSVALLKGVILTLLPGFLAGVVAAAIWWWSKDFALDPNSADAVGDAVRGLRSPRLTLVWIMLVIAFYTISWPVLVVFLLPVAAITVLLIGQSRGHWVKSGRTKRLLGTLRLLSAGAAVVAILFVALSPTVWLPLQDINLKPGYSAELNGTVLPSRFAAFLLSSNAKTTSLLLDSPRGVVVISTNGMQPNPPLCILPVSLPLVVLAGIPGSPRGSRLWVAVRSLPLTHHSRRRRPPTRLSWSGPVLRTHRDPAAAGPATGLIPAVARSAASRRGLVLLAVAVLTHSGHRQTMLDIARLAVHLRR